MQVKGSECVQVLMLCEVQMDLTQRAQQDMPNLRPARWQSLAIDVPE